MNNSVSNYRYDAIEDVNDKISSGIAYKADTMRYFTRSGNFHNVFQLKGKLFVGYAYYESLYLNRYINWICVKDIESSKYIDIINYGYAKFSIQEDNTSITVWSDDEDDKDVTIELYVYYT